MERRGRDRDGIGEENRKDEMRKSRERGGKRERVRYKEEERRGGGGRKS